MGDSVESAASADDQQLAVHLLCLPLELVASAFQNIEWMSCHSWPTQGSLLVDVNRTKSHGKSWLPHFFGMDNVPLNITDAIQLGKNTIRCIQLSSLQHLFAIHASVARPTAAEVEEEPSVIKEAPFDHRASEQPDNTPIHTQPEEFMLDIKIDYG
ncbi:hypothetical protein BDP27DRAFT_1326235 [Rhodocollybia butyracea]|uniref:Uncharacterized protein n=1 Tax=Rhodocollybia butyracea TaxID=206335 RepID=A0A9P5PVT3_9AGAR|nr:hypothetical protein BDP27DRAFT_1326235 [Rhodocollybia butyracea]